MPLARWPHSDNLPTMSTVQEIEQAAMNLPPANRAKLAGLLLESLESGQEKESAEVWADEAQARAEAYRRGQLKSVPVHQAFGFDS